MILFTFFLFCSEDVEPPRKRAKTLAYETREQSPPQNQIIKVAVTAVTPGQQAAEQQALISKEFYKKILGEEIESWDVDWNILQNTEINFDDSQKRQTLRKIDQKLKRISTKRFDKDFTSLHGEFLRIKSMSEIVHEHRAEEMAHEYFSKQFPGSKVGTQPKSDGVQLGNKVNVITREGQTLKYHVKTHSEGRLSEKSTAAKVVRPEELLVYKFLELSNLGSQVHFFQRSPEDVYVATLDASFQSINEAGQFYTFEKCQASKLDSLTGGLATMNMQDLDAVESRMKETNVEDFAVSLVLTDLLSRIFRLGDVSDNSGNFGFCFLNGSALLKIIDFRIKHEESYLIREGHFGGFLEGNGEFNYAADARPYFLYIMHKRARDLRVQTGKLAMQKLQNKREQIKAAYEFVREYIIKSSEFKAREEQLLVSLETYYQAVEKNFEFMRKKLENYGT